MPFRNQLEKSIHPPPKPDSDKIFVDLTEAPKSVFVPTPVHEAIFHDVENGIPAAIIARAGSGKTTTLTEATKHVNSVKNRVLMTTFGRDAKRDIALRVPESIRVETVHALGRRLLINHDRRIEYVKGRGMKIIASLTPNGEPGDRNAVHEAVARCKNTLASTREEVEKTVESLDVVIPTYSRGEVADLTYKALAIAQQPDGTMDYDDMIWLPNVWDIRAPIYDVMFVDEVQDLNLTQVGLLDRVRQRDTRTYVVGDQRQSIYLWRGAHGDAINLMSTIFGINSKHLLPVSYRCDQAIIQYAQQIVPDIQARPNAGPGIVNTPSNIDGAQPGDYIISRANRDLFGAQRKLRRLNKPCTIVGDKFQKVLESLLRKSKATTVPGLLNWLNLYRETELAEIQSKHPEPTTVRARLFEDIEDRVDSLRELAVGLDTIRDVGHAIQEAFAHPQAHHIRLTTVHKVKGLESDRTWIIADSFAWFRFQYSRQYQHEAMQPISVEDENLAYVAITRARHEMNIVIGTRKI